MASSSPIFSAPLPLLHRPHSSTFPSTTQFLLLPNNPSPLPPHSTPTPSSSPTLLGEAPSSSSSSSSSTPTRKPQANPSKAPLSFGRQRRSLVSRPLPPGRLSTLSRAISSLPLPSSSSSSSSFLSTALRKLLPKDPDRDTAFALLNSLHPWQRAYHLFRWLQSLQDFQVETIFYNVVMKSLRAGHRYDLVEELAQEMVSRGIEMDNVTYSTVITCAKTCREFDCAVGWFKRMHEMGLMPDGVTYSAMLDVYAHSGKVGEVLSLFESARACGWKPDTVALVILAKASGEIGDCEGIQNVLKEMKNFNMESNVVLYNTLIEAYGKAGKPRDARKLFNKMLRSGLEPNRRTLVALIKIYGKARWDRNALELLEQIRANNWPMDLFCYNTLLSMCADLRLEKEAEMLFAEMKKSERSKPDSRSYTAMVNIYAIRGKADKAIALFKEMLECGLEPNVMCFTCLIQCFGKARRMDDVVMVFDVLIERGVKPDDRLCCCLLSVLGLCDEGGMGKILECLDKADPRLFRFINMLGDDQVRLNMVKEEFRGILNETSIESRRPFCNCLIDVCHNQNFPAQRARELFRLGTMYGLYPHLHTKDLERCSLNLRTLSFGAAYVAFEEWMRMLAGNLKRDEDTLPRLFFIHTGTGSRKFVDGLANAFASHLAEQSAPFHQKEMRDGFFVATRDDLVPWLQARTAALADCT